MYKQDYDVWRMTDPYWNDKGTVDDAAEAIVADLSIEELAEWAVEHELPCLKALLEDIEDTDAIIAIVLADLPTATSKYINTVLEARHEFEVERIENGYYEDGEPRWEYKHASLKRLSH
jgi:hypothetical protein